MAALKLKGDYFFVFMLHVLLSIIYASLYYTLSDY